MITPKRTVVAVAALSVTAVAVGAQAGNAAPPQTTSSATSPAPAGVAGSRHALAFTALEADRTETFIRATPSGGLGDQFVEHEVLRGRGGRVVGEVAGNCLTVNAPDTALPPALVRCTFTYLLAGGQITTEGLVPRANYLGCVLAVTGGTGRYATARGRATTVLSAAEEHDNTITIDLR